MTPKTVLRAAPRAWLLVRFLFHLINSDNYSLFSGSIIGIIVAVVGALILLLLLLLLLAKRRRQAKAAPAPPVALAVKCPPHVIVALLNAASVVGIPWKQGQRCNR